MKALLFILGITFHLVLIITAVNEKNTEITTTEYPADKNHIEDSLHSFITLKELRAMNQ